MAKRKKETATPALSTLPGSGEGFSLSALDLSETIDSEDYERQLSALQRRLQLIQQAYLTGGHRAIVILEGWDAAGKGGTIRRIGWAMDPRSLKVWPIAAPEGREADHHYLYRFWVRLPAKREIAIFDRSWYGRVLVERVEGFATEAEWRRAYDEIVHFERLLVDDGVRIVKLFLHISQEEQLARFRDRLKTPAKRWKLSYDDFRNRGKWETYTDAIEEMVRRTHTLDAPWHIVATDSKKLGRILAISAIVEHLSAGIDLSPAEPDPELLKLARKELGEKDLG